MSRFLPPREAETRSKFRIFLRLQFANQRQPLGHEQSFFEPDTSAPSSHLPITRALPHLSHFWDTFRPELAAEGSMRLRLHDRQEEAGQSEKAWQGWLEIL